MRGLLRLYPRTWRDRYEAEFQAVLDERPPTLSDSIDIVRGALDAHLHPTVGANEPAPWTHRLPGLAALTAGLLWSELYVSAAFRPDPGREWGPTLGLFMIAAFFSLPGDYMAAHGRQIAIGLGAWGMSFVLANVAGSGLAAAAFGAAALFIAFCGPLALAAIRAGIAPAGRWLLLAGAVVVPIAAVLALYLLRELTRVTLVPEGSPQSLVAAVPYGLAWVLVGIRMTVRGAPTLVDPPPATAMPQPEVNAA